MDRQSRWPTGVRAPSVRLVAVVLLSAAVAFYAYLGFSMRLMADDYCYASE